MRSFVPLSEMSAQERRIIVALSTTTALLWIGASAIAPFLPIYLRERGSSVALVGLIMASYFLASTVTQIPLGHLGDAVGHRGVIVAGLAVFAGGSVGFAVAGSPLWAIVFRALQGIGTGALTVGAAATIAVRTSAANRGAAFGTLYGSRMVAFAIGPILGSLSGSGSLRTVFFGTAGLSLLAVAPVALLLRERQLGSVCATGPFRSQRDAPEGRGRSTAGLPLNRAVTGALVVFLATGYFSGMSEVCWTLLLRLRHASTYDVGLSWTLFAILFAVLSVPAGRLANRLEPRLLCSCSLTWTALFSAVYPLLHDVLLLVGLAAVEAVGAVVAAPTALVVLSGSLSMRRQGAAQGVAQTAQTAAIALAAAISGALFSQTPPLPFDVAALCGVVGAVVLFALWPYHTLKAT